MYLWIGLFITAALLSSNGLCADPLQADGTTISAQSAKGSLFRLTSSNFSPQLAKSYCSNSALEPTTDPTYQAEFGVSQKPP